MKATLNSHVREIIQEKQSVFEIVFERKKIEVFCPCSQQKEIHNILTQLFGKGGSKVQQLLSTKKKVVLYHNTHLIEPIDKLHLIYYIEQGFIAYSIIDFLEKVNGHADITLLDLDYFIGEKDFSVLRNKPKVFIKHIMDYFTRWSY